MKSPGLFSRDSAVWTFLKKCWLRVAKGSVNVETVDIALLAAEDHARSAEEDAAILECIMASGDSAHILPRCLEMMALHAEDLLSDDRQLREVAAAGIPCQAETIRSLRPLLRSLAWQLDSLTHCPGTWPGIACTLPSIEHARDIALLVGRTACLVHDLVEWGHDGATTEVLHHQLMSSHEDAK